MIYTIYCGYATYVYENDIATFSWPLACIQDKIVQEKRRELVGVVKRGEFRCAMRILSSMGYSFVVSIELSINQNRIRAPTVPVHRIYEFVNDREKSYGCIY